MDILRREMGLEKKFKNLCLPYCINENADITEMDEPTAGTNGEELPQTFSVKYLGWRQARGLWGVKHTRVPVDSMVSAAKTPGSTPLPMMSLQVTTTGCTLYSPTLRKLFPIETISYGVQDLIYTRVFCMIVVRDGLVLPGDSRSPFECHGFACDSRSSARRLTHCLAAAFAEYSSRLRLRSTTPHPAAASAAVCRQVWERPKFAVDLRTPEELRAEVRADSEA